MSGIALVHPGGLVSMDHITNMSLTAQAVHGVIKSRGSKRHHDASRDRFENAPSFNATVEEWWRSADGSRRQRRLERRLRRIESDYDRRERKTAKPHRPTRHELTLVSMHADFRGVYPFRVTVPQSAPQAVDMSITSVMSGPRRDICAGPVLALNVLRAKGMRAAIDAHDAAATQREHLGLNGVPMERWNQFFQQPKPEAKANPDRRAIVEENEARYFGNARQYVLANSRGI